MYESGATRSGRRGQVRETARLSQTKKSFRLRPLSGNGKKKFSTVTGSTVPSDFATKQYGLTIDQINDPPSPCYLKN